MADSTISDLPAIAYTSVDDLMVIVSGGITYKISFDNFLTSSGFAVLPIDAGTGNYLANIIPRTGVFSSLSALSGGNGELGSITDRDWIVQFSGVAGEAQLFKPNGVQYLTLTADRVLTKLTGGRIECTLSPAASSWDLTLPNGVYTNQQVEVAVVNDGQVGFAVITPAIALGEGQSVKFRWDGAAWTPFGFISQDFAGTGWPTAQGDVLIAPTAIPTASGYGNDIMIGDGAFSSGTAVGSGIAIGVSSRTTDYATAVGSGAEATGMQGTAIGYLAKAENNYEIALGQIGRRFFKLRRNTTNATPAQLSLDGAVPVVSAVHASTNNNYLLNDTTTALQLVNVKVLGWTSGTGNFTRFERKCLFSYYGGNLVLLNTETVGTDTNSGLPATAISITADNVSKCINVTVTGIAATTIRWSAFCEVLQNAA